MSRAVSKHPRRPIVACTGKHGPKQRIVTRSDGSRVQVCERCGDVIAVLSRPIRRAS